LAVAAGPVVESGDRRGGLSTKRERIVSPLVAQYAAQVAAQLVVAIDALVAAVSTYRQMTRGLYPQENFDMDQLWQRVNKLSLDAGFGPAPQWSGGAAGLYLEMPGLTNPNRRDEARCREWDERMRALREKAKAAAEAALSLAVPPAGAKQGDQAEGTGRRRRKRRGRPSDTDPKADKRIYDAWQTRQYKNYAELAVALSLSEREVELAVDRVRKRRKN
jgi:hypothetical protein